jgi:hypothetical protein
MIEVTYHDNWLSQDGALIDELDRVAVEGDKYMRSLIDFLVSRQQLVSAGSLQSSKWAGSVSHFKEEGVVVIESQG